MYSHINIENLERCIVNSEAAPGFYLGSYWSTCGTYGCLVGNDYIQTCRGVGPNRESLIPWATAEYGIEYPGNNGSLKSHEWYGGTIWAFLFGGWKRNSGTSRDEALSRLRKYVAYVKRKRAIWHEADGRVKESARRTEGDLNILRAALDEVAQQELTAAV